MIVVLSTVYSSRAHTLKVIIITTLPQGVTVLWNGKQKETLFADCDHEKRNRAYYIKGVRTC